jgi:hypothetical protein
MMGWLFRYAIGRKIVYCLVPQGLLHVGLIKVPGVGYMLVPGSPPWAYLRIRHKRLRPVPPWASSN